MSPPACPTCDPGASAITDDDTGALICAGCGTVLEHSNEFVHQVIFLPNGTIDCSGTALVRPDLTYRDRKIYAATEEFKSIATHLGLSSSMSEEALQLARDATDGELATKDSSFLAALSAACSYLVARRHNLPVYLDEAAAVALCESCDLAHLVKRISRQLNLDPLPEYDNGSALDRFLRTSQLLSDTDRLEEIIGQAKFLLDCAAKWSLSTGRHPRPLAAAVATIAAQANGIAAVSVDDFAAEMGAVVSTSRTRYKEMVKALAHAAKVLVPWGSDLTGKNVAQNAPLLLRLMELKSKSNPSDLFLENFVVDTSSFLKDCTLPVGEEEAKYFKINETRITNGEEDTHLKNVKLSAECLSSTYQNVRERVSNLKNAGAIGRGAEKRKRCHTTFQVDFWVNKLDERRWKSHKKLTPDEILNTDMGFDMPPPSFVSGLKLRERRREKIKAAKCRIDQVRIGPGTSKNATVEENVCGKSAKGKRKRKGAIDGVDWEDCIIELLLLHGVNEAEIEEGQYKRLLNLHVLA
ncbi:Plant-specific TFIIB-related protein PTF2 [Rhynchospora pubera]|uniref:Plant-specific TFIIB-related protein PTF2 n=1 Tax=Rhynchospora pubera TaxID=906938 RepID=A0AAV8FDX3_9POAL|nr:Plant-specific TFIIB-related protein PTF2 [Rhynchospora pubera]